MISRKVNVKTNSACSLQPSVLSISSNTTIPSILSLWILFPVMMQSSHLMMGVCTCPSSGLQPVCGQRVSHKLRNDTNQIKSNYSTSYSFLMDSSSKTHWLFRMLHDSHVQTLHDADARFVHCHILKYKQLWEPHEHLPSHPNGSDAGSSSINRYASWCDDSSVSRSCWEHSDF